MKVVLLILSLFLTVLMVFLCIQSSEMPEKVILGVEEEISETLEEISEVKNLEISWLNWPKVRDVNHLGKVLSDIDSHLPIGHMYSDFNKITWAHETTHGINSAIRNHHVGKKINGFYVLEDQAVVIEEPNITIRDVAISIPESLRGPSYHIYLVQQAISWGNSPLYLFDEWTAYTNGSACGIELNLPGTDFELLQANNFNVYCLYLAKAVQERVPDYNDQQLKLYLIWNTERVHHLSQGVYGKPGLEYLDKLQHVDAESIRSFARDYLGATWCKTFYHF